MHVKRQLLFVQGGGEGVHDEWDNKLVESLKRELGPGYEIRYPQMPNEDEPRYAAWKATLDERVRGARRSRDSRRSLAWRSSASQRCLPSRQPRKFGAIVLIAAPFIGDGGWSSDDLKSSTTGWRMKPHRHRCGPNRTQ